MSNIYGPQELEVYFNSKEVKSEAKRWVKLLKDYDCTIEYHPKKVNVVADALS